MHSPTTETCYPPRPSCPAARTPGHGPALCAVLALLFTVAAFCLASPAEADTLQSPFDMETHQTPFSRATRHDEDRAQCYRLRHGPVKTGKKGKKTGGRCQPQSLVYARCRSHIDNCRLGDTSPVQWFACAKTEKRTSSVPVPGAVMVLDGNRKRGMPTGHPVYVEEVYRNRDGSFDLRISHTNYDRRCSLDLDARVHYDPRSMNVAFRTGPWKGWATNLRTLGFITP